MGKLYLFGIGGTGARVIRSFTMLLAAGVECKATEVIPVIIDPDRENGDVRRTENILKQYHGIREFEREGSGNSTKKMRVLDFIKSNASRQNKFFGMQITEPSLGYTLPINILNRDEQSFGKFIEEENLPQGSKALVNMLFSKSNLNLELTHGFKGNPNIGSVVLNQFEESGLRDLLKDFHSDDRIFIISSIFGGTGSSGFPLLLKTLRSDQTREKGGRTISEYVRNACIGAITVMPYFQVNAAIEGKSDVNSQTFISKTIAAMDYYHKAIIGRHGEKTHMCIDYLYSIADSDHMQTNDRCEGGDGQKNEAHFVELASALAICDFMSKDAAENNDSHITQKLRFAVTSEGTNGELTFDNLSKNTLDILGGPLTQLWLVAKYLTEVGEKRFCELPCGAAFSKNFFRGEHSFYGKLLTFLNHFGGAVPDGSGIAYLDELAESKSFVPYLRHGDNDIFDRIRGVAHKKNSFFKPNATGWNLLETNMNAQRHALKGQLDEERFLEIFWRSTNESVKKRLSW